MGIFQAAETESCLPETLPAAKHLQKATDGHHSGAGVSWQL